MNTTVIDIATKFDIIEGAPNRTLESAILIMGTKKFRRLPITKLGKIKGILTVTDIIRAISIVGLPEAYKEKISDWMTVTPKTANINLSLIEATKIMSQGNFGSLLLTEEDNEILRGIITERDILHHYHQKKFTNKNLSDLDPNLLTSDYVKIRYDLSLEDAIKKMNEHHVHRVLTVDDSGLLKGILSANDITILCSKEREEINANPNFLKSINAQFVASDNVITCNMNMSLQETIDLMCEKQIGGLPIMKDEELVGMITERSLLHIIAKLDS